MTRLLISLVLFFGVTANAQSVTLEKLLTAPFPAEILAAPTGNKIAWIQTERGRCNLFVAAAPDYHARQLTKYNQDDGQQLTSITWSADAKTIVYVRGGAANRNGEIPNPTSNPSGVEQAVWRIAIDGGEPVKIGAGNAPAISPRGDVVAFLRRGQIFSAMLNDTKEAKQLLQARGAASSLRWSPDGTKLAFVSNRGDHNFIGVYDVAGKSVRFPAPSVDEDSNPVWSPDGSRIAFIRQPTTGMKILFTPERTAEPWSIIVVDCASGQSKTIWCADEGRGSALHAIVAENQLLWSADNRIIFPWERDGWSHLYAVATSGGSPILLTPGAFEVEFATLSPDQREIIFNSNQDDIDRRHLWRVKTSGSNPQALTSGTGIEWNPTATSDGKAIAFLASDARQPAHVAIKIGNEIRAVTNAPADFPAQDLVEPQAVIIDAADGLKIHAQLFLPKNRGNEKHPAAIFFHGGSRRQMLLGWHYRDYYHNTYAMNQYLASRGFVVLSVNYRSGIGYGLDFREALNYGASGASEFNDVMGAGLYLRGRSDVDGKRMGVYGGSYGGYLTALGLSRASDLFAAGVDIHGVHDWNVGIKTFVPGYNPLDYPKESKLAFDSSPMSSVDGWRSPVLVIHGDDDRNVSFSETVTLVRALRTRKVEVEQLIFPDEIHGFLLHKNWLAAFTAASDFFGRKLQK